MLSHVNLFKLKRFSNLLTGIALFSSAVALRIFRGILRQGSLTLDPFDYFSAFPATFFPLIISFDVAAIAMLFSVEPLSVIHPAISPNVFASSFLLVFNELPDVAGSVTPGKSAESIHEIFFPFTIVCSTVSPLINTMSFHFVINEATYELA